MLRALFTHTSFKIFVSSSVNSSFEYGFVRYFRSSEREMKASNPLFLAEKKLQEFFPSWLFRGQSEFIHSAACVRRNPPIFLSASSRLLVVSGLEKLKEWEE